MYLLWNTLNGGTPAIINPASTINNAATGICSNNPPSLLILLVLVLYNTKPNPTNKNEVTTNSFTAWNNPAVILYGVPYPSPTPI